MCVCRCWCICLVATLNKTNDRFEIWAQLIHVACCSSFIHQQTLSLCRPYPALFLKRSRVSCTHVTTCGTRSGMVTVTWVSPDYLTPQAESKGRGRPGSQPPRPHWRGLGRGVSLGYTLTITITSGYWWDICGHLSQSKIHRQVWSLVPRRWLPCQLASVLGGFSLPF